MRGPIASFDGRQFDVAVIGAGINGAAVALALAGAGYRTLLVDKGDFGSGASSRSSRMLHCGLRYLAPGATALDLLHHPGRFWAGVRMAREALAARTDFVQRAPTRVRAFTFCMPIYDDAVYPGWQVDVAFNILRALAPPGGVPLDYRRVAGAAARSLPLIGALRDGGRVRSVATFREYQYDWPERICVDAALEAERTGSVVRNYTEVEALERLAGGRWRLTLCDGLVRDTARIEAEIVLNMAGMWVDCVNGRVHDAVALGRKVVGMKGTHILVRLAPDCAGHGLLTTTRHGGPFFCMPASGGLHYFGLTDARHDGDPDDVRPTEAEIGELLAEAEYALPALGLTRGDVVAAWSGVCPYTYDPNLPKGKRTRDLHDLETEALPNLLALTGGSIRTHRLVGAEVLRTVRRRLVPSQAAPPPVSPDAGFDGAVRPDPLRAAAQEAAREHVVTLADFLFRRVDFGWTDFADETLTACAAEALGEAFGWDEPRRAAEIARFDAYVREQHMPRAAGAAKLWAGNSASLIG